MASLFPVAGNIETSTLKDSKLTLNTQRSMVLHICMTHVTNVTESQTLVCSQPFLIADHIETQAWNKPNMTLNTKRSKTPYIPWVCVVTYINHFEASALSDPQKNFWTLKGQRYPKYVLLVFQTPKFHFILLYDLTIFNYIAILRKVHWMTPKGPWTRRGERHLICFTSVAALQITFRFALQLAIQQMFCCHHQRAKNTMMLKLKRTICFWFT